MKRALLILAAFGYVMFFIMGIDTGLGVYRSPSYCWAAFACALVAAACVSKRQRRIWIIAGVIAMAASFYGYHQNNEWRERLERIRTRQAPPSTSQTGMNRSQANGITGP